MDLAEKGLGILLDDVLVEALLHIVEIIEGHVYAEICRLQLIVALETVVENAPHLLLDVLHLALFAGLLGFLLGHRRHIFQ